MTAYVIVDIDVHDPVRYEDYKRLATASIAAHGGKYLVRGGKVDIMDGEWVPNRLVILEFADADAARKWFDSDEYREAKKARAESALANMIIVEGI
ncbi:MAG TPA: DUF1330 domain-containing protein [Thermoanaerobaculia bacterium]|nr:DUF1330 domain-containing protein [Thermoanaerobaculia bacterium]